MKAVIRYVADDGSEWRDEHKAAKRDAEVRNVEGIMAHLKAKPDDTSFSNGSGYVQQDPAQVQRCREALLDLELADTKDESWKAKLRQLKDPAVDLSWALRFLDNGGPISKALGRLYCIDKDAREWGQPYYAMNPDEGQQREWAA